MSDLEKLAEQIHDIYQTEAKRQGDVRHKDSYAELSENVKEFDRVLARFTIDREAALIERVEDLERELAATGEWCMRHKPSQAKVYTGCWGCSREEEMQKVGKFIECECENGRVEDDGIERECPICDGDRHITLETVSEYAKQIRQFSKENQELRFAYKKSRTYSCQLTAKLQFARELAAQCENVFASHHTPTMDMHLAKHLERIQDRAREFLEKLK